MAKRETSNKKRKLEPENTPEAVSVERTMPYSLNPVLPMEIKTEA